MSNMCIVDVVWGIYQPPSLFIFSVFSFWTNYYTLITSKIVPQPKSWVPTGPSSKSPFIVSIFLGFIIRIEAIKSVICFKKYGNYTKCLGPFCIGVGKRLDIHKFGSYNMECLKKRVY